MLQIKMERPFRIGDLVFAKVRGRPFWPGKIEKISPNSAKSRYLVLFYGTLQRGLCKKKDMFLYEEMKGRFQHYKIPKFHQAVAEMDGVAHARRAGPKIHITCQNQMLVDTYAKYKEKMEVLTRQLTASKNELLSLYEYEKEPWLHHGNHCRTPVITRSVTRAQEHLLAKRALARQRVDVLERKVRLFHYNMMHILKDLNASPNSSS